jgi:hypothetical protein
MLTIGLAIGLFGCDQSPKATAPAPVAVAAAPTCACQHQAQATPAPVAPEPRPHRHHRNHHHGMSYEASWQESTSSASSYSESRVSEYAGESHESSDEPPAAPYPPPPPPDHGSGVWIDGYGRSHFSSEGTAAEADSNPALLSVEDGRRRSDPWRGYNSRCRNAVD